MPIPISALGYYSITLKDTSIDKMLQIYLKPKVFELDEITEYPGCVQRLQTAKKVMTTKVSPDVSMFLDLPEVTVKGRDKSMEFNFEEEAVWAPNLDSLDPDGYKYMDIFDLLVKEYNAIDYTTPWGTHISFLPSIGKEPYFVPVFLIDGVLVFNGGPTRGLTTI